MEEKKYEYKIEQIGGRVPFVNYTVISKIKIKNKNCMGLFF